MQVVLWICRIFIFLFLLGFSFKNTQVTDVHFFLGTNWQAPLIIILLAFFTLGALLGVLTLLGKLFKLKREVSQLKRELHKTKQNPS